MKYALVKKIWLYVCVIVGFGLIALYSASFENARVPQSVFYDQLWCAGLGLLVMYLLSRIHYRRFFDVAYVVYGISLVLLLFVLVSGRDALGARRWLTIGGISFQPSEFVKLALVLALARYWAVRRPRKVFYRFEKIGEVARMLIVPLVLTLVPFVLIFKQPDLGTALLLFGGFLFMVFASEVPYPVLGWVWGLCVCAVPLGWHILRPYQKDRLLVFLNPNIDPLGAGYTIIQSKIAVGSGQIFGKGWLAGTQNQLNFLPERHTDFIFSVIGEEWGVAGTLLLVYCYFALIRYSLRIAEQVNDRFGMLVAVGIASLMALQVVINIGMVIGLCPVVGLTLPFVSYGRSSFLVSAMMMGFLLNLARRRTIF